MILLYNRIHMEGRKPCANRGPVCTLENFQWCENLVLQALQFQEVGVRRKFLGGVGASHY
jgi:hypothetical protein